MHFTVLALLSTILYLKSYNNVYDVGKIYPLLKLAL